MDFLKDVLGDDLFKQVADKLVGKEKEIKLGNLATGEYINKGKHEADLRELTTEKDAFKTEVDTLTKSIEDLNESSGDAEKLKADIQTIKDESAQKIADIETEKTKLKKDYSISIAIRDAGGKNAKAIKANLDLDKVSVDGDNIIGLSDQLKTLAESDAYLFGDPKEIKTDSANPGEVDEDDLNPDEGKATDQEVFDKRMEERKKS